MAMWAMFAAPLEIAADVRSIRNSSAAILLNKEVIGVQQDPLVRQGRRVSNIGGVNVWKTAGVSSSAPQYSWNEIPGSFASVSGEASAS